MAEFSGYYTQYGRPIWRDDDGSFYSERSTTMRGTDGLWYNLPTVVSDGSILPEAAVGRFYNQKGLKDPVTGAVIEGFRSNEEAVNAARERSNGIQWIARPGR